MVTLICRFVAYSARIVIDIQTDRQNDYRNPRCACAPRVYPTWKVQCRMALVRDGLWGIVEGTETAPPAEGTADRRSKFIARRDRALATIVLAVEPSLLYLIGDPKTPLLFGRSSRTSFRRKRGRTN